jgi:hypothetical protein
MATYLTYRGKKHKVELPTITLRTHKLMLDWSAKLDAQAKADSRGVQLGAIRKMLDSFPEALDYIDVVGNVNSEKLNARITFITEDEQRKAHEAHEAGAEYEPLQPEAIREEAYKWVMDKWQQWVKDNPDAALMLMFQATEYPTDIDSLLLGIDCIKATAITTDGELAQLIQGDIETDFWQDIDATEVAAYCTAFLKAFKKN